MSISIYKVYDDNVLVSKHDTLNEARNAAQKYYKEKDGDCNLQICRYVFNKYESKYEKQPTEYKIWL